MQKKRLRLKFGINLHYSPQVKLPENVIYQDRPSTELLNRQIIRRKISQMDVHGKCQRKIKDI